MTESQAKFVYVFGPVPSRRLGRSLGVDLAPRKVCTFDCVYCQVGRTTRKTSERAAFMPVADILAEIKAKLEKGPRPDFITLSGSGEPTLNSAMTEIIEGIRAITDVPVAIITNGSLLQKLEVRRACAKADVVLPSLDAGEEKVFQAINRPVEGITLDSVVQGMADFRREFNGQIWLEVFLIPGMNDSPAQIAAIRKLIPRIRPDRIQLNTAVRPTAEEGIKALSEAEMHRLAEMLDPNAEVIADFKAPVDTAGFAAKDEEALDMMRRRPVTVDDLAAGLGIAQAEAIKHVERLLKSQKIRLERRDGKNYYLAL